MEDSGQAEATVDLVCKHPSGAAVRFTVEGSADMLDLLVAYVDARKPLFSWLHAHGWDPLPVKEG